MQATINELKQQQQQQQNNEGGTRSEEILQGKTEANDYKKNKNILNIYIIEIV